MIASRSVSPVAVLRDVFWMPVPLKEVSFSALAFGDPLIHEDVMYHRIVVETSDRRAFLVIDRSVFSSARGYGGHR